MYSFMVEDNSEHKKSKIMNKNVFPKRILSEDKDVLLNDKRLRHSINRIYSKNHEILTYKISKISLLSFEAKIYVLKNRYDRPDVSLNSFSIKP